MTSAQDEMCDWIERAFATYRDDGEFASPANESAFGVILPLETQGMFVYTTKPSVVSAAITASGTKAVGMVGRYGLPTRVEVGWLCGLFHGCRIGFLGDCDPVDLMIYAWLRSKMRSRQLVHLGVNDGLLAAARIDRIDAISLGLSESELSCIDTLFRHDPRIVDTIGVASAGLLRQGSKVEIEGVISSACDGFSLVSAVLAGFAGE